MSAPFQGSGIWGGQRKGQCPRSKNAWASGRQPPTQTVRLGFLDAFAAFAEQQLEIASLARLCSKTTNAIGVLMAMTFTLPPLKRTA